jgi:hypothetical protein
LIAFTVIRSFIFIRYCHPTQSFILFVYQGIGIDRAEVEEERVASIYFTL